MTGQPVRWVLGGQLCRCTRRIPSLLSSLYVPAAASAILGGPAGRCRFRRSDLDADPPRHWRFRIKRSFQPSRSASISRLVLRFGDAVDESRQSKRASDASNIVGIYAGDAAEFSRSLAGQPWLDPGRDRHHLHRARRALTKVTFIPSPSCRRCRRPAVGAILALMCSGRICR